jgi:hypothetical protein
VEQRLQARETNKANAFPVLLQRVVNHVPQAFVNHAGGCKAGWIRLTSLFKRFSHGLWQGPPIDRKHNFGGEIKS